MCSGTDGIEDYAKDAEAERGRVAVLWPATSQFSIFSLDIFGELFHRSNYTHNNMCIMGAVMVGEVRVLEASADGCVGRG